MRLGHRKIRALVGAASRAPVADPTLWRAGDDDAVADGNSGDRGADLLHHSDGCVTEDRGQLLHEVAPPVHAIRVAQRARRHPHDHVARTGREDLHVLDDEWRSDLDEERRPHRCVVGQARGIVVRPYDGRLEVSIASVTVAGARG